ncbi:MAG: hypothetical protein M0T80_09845, partial [Actinomycetota bacterium]|nr:hypothetical protein [Actinomycetota bacterium]
AFAAGSGYGPPGASSSPSAGGFTKVVASTTAVPAASSLSGSYGGSKFALSIPSGDFTTPTQVTAYAPTNLSSVRGVAGIEIVFSNPATGSRLTGTSLLKPITVVLSGAGIVKGDVVEVYNGTRYVAYTGSYSTSTGSVSITIDADPTFVVVPPPRTTVPPVTVAKAAVPPNVPGATSVHTGKPFLGEELAAGAAAATGLAAIAAALGIRRQRQAA